MNERAGQWAAEVLWQDGIPCLRWVSPNGETEVAPAVGSLLEYDADRTNERRCVGGYRYEAMGATFEPCVHQPAPARRQCEPCERRDNIHAATFHQSHQRTLDTVRTELRPRLEQPHVLYLAAFRDGSLKVGTSVATRLDTRLTEQGAWRAIAVAHAVDGLVVRHVEDDVTRVDGISQTVHGSRKVAGHAQPRPDDALDRALTDAAERVAHTVLEWEQHGVTPADDRWCNRASDEPVWSRAVAHPTELDRGRHRFTITHVCGKIALVTIGSIPDEHLVVDLSRVCGIPMSHTPIDPDPIALQTSLF